MREYKGTVNGERITVYLTEKQMWKLVNSRFNLHSSHWITGGEYTEGEYKEFAKECSLCRQYKSHCEQCPLGKGKRRSVFCVRILRVISPWVAKFGHHTVFCLNKDGSIPKRMQAAFKKVQAVLLAGKRIARRPKEET